MSEHRQDIMISYKRANRSTADELYAELASAGLSPWLDYKSIKPGDKWRDELLKKVRDCSTLVALLTPGYVQSEHCRTELYIARSRGCVVLPVMLEDCFTLLDRYEETKGLADTFMVRLYKLSVVGLTITRKEAIQRIVTAALSIGQELPKKKVYVAYCNGEAELATRIAQKLESAGVTAWVATRDCRVGDNWRQAQARAVTNAEVQVVVMDDTIADADVLRTEILLAEAFGLRVFTVLGSKLASDDDAVSEVMMRLGAADITFRRLSELHAFGCDAQSLLQLSELLRSSSRSAGA